ncbi:DUF4919 domain-containing protein [Cryomorphaceae bacterium 1068]|nr:DUF4919 domain-containing protein [Cryomorphaceae bacterium 1068]
MKKGQLLTVVFFVFSIMGFTQDVKPEKPDYKTIKKEISKKKSEFYYPDLLERFQNADTTMTLKEKRYLYYGYSFQDAYSPYGESDYEDSLRTLARKENPTEPELKKICDFADSVLVESPFNLTAINSQLYALDELQEILKFNERLSQMQMVLDALFSSGDGLEKETAFYVLYVSHEYAVLSIMGYEFRGQSLIEHYDYLTVAKNPEKIEGFYFDISPCLDSMKEMFK